MNEGYRDFIRDNFRIVNKESELVGFDSNPRHWNLQSQFLTGDHGNKIAVLKARQQGFSSIILALFTTDFLLKENSRSVIVADIADNASELLDRVKLYLKTYEEINNVKIPLKYNSKYELFNEAKNSRYTIGTADNADFGRSKTITNLHFSEFAFYPNPERLFTGAMQAVVPTGRTIIETTANGFNFFKDFWDECKLGERPFTPLFYKASAFYSEDFLAMKRLELQKTFKQEYPESDFEAFLTSGEQYFDSEALQRHLSNVRAPMTEGFVYAS